MAERTSPYLGTSPVASTATAVIASAARLAAAEETARQLRHALESRVIIEQVKGILAGERKISVDMVFSEMRAHARRN